MKDEKLIVGLPAGSLADPNRGGNLVNVLKNAGFPTEGYDRGGPSTFTCTPFIVGWDGRPQEFGAQLGIGEIDIAIAGEDWMQERRLEFLYEFQKEIDFEQVFSLKRGDVRIVIISQPNDKFKSTDAMLKDLFKRQRLITMVSEMPYLALSWIEKKINELGFSKSLKQYAVQKFKTPPRIKSGVVIYETWGKTEAKVKNGSADLGLEITQSGSAIKNYGLSILDTIMESRTSVYANPKIKKDKKKYELARMFLLNLYGSVYAEDKVLVLFNAKKDNVDKICKYLKSNSLFADEPTMNHGVNFTEFSVQMCVKNEKLPIARARYELASMGATGIDTVPLKSSIPGIDVLKF
jgi:ATP phosphoribosyltransferase